MTPPIRGKEDPGRSRTLRRLRPLGRLGEDIQAIFDHDPAARTVPEVLVCYPGLHAVILHRLAHKLWGWRFYFLARFLSHLSRVWIC